MQQPAQSGLISIIIVNWNTRDLLADCIRSVTENTTDVCYEVVVVDNASADGSAEAIRAAFPAVRVVDSGDNLGFAAGNNLGMRFATGEFVLFLNPDTLVEGDALRRMRDFLTENAGAGAVGCKLLGCTGATQESYWMDFPNERWLLRKAFYLDKFSHRLRDQKRALAAGPTEVAHLLGACIMAPLSVIREMGGFDESYFLYLEETDLCFRLKEAGYSIWYLPSASIVHTGQQSSNQAAQWANVQLQRSMFLFLSRRFSPGPVRRTTIKALMMLGALVRLALWNLRFVLGLTERGLARRMISGYARLIAAIPAFACRTRRQPSDDKAARVLD